MFVNIASADPDNMYTCQSTLFVWFFFTCRPKFGFLIYSLEAWDYICICCVLKFRCLRTPAMVMWLRCPLRLLPSWVAQNSKKYLQLIQEFYTRLRGEVIWLQKQKDVLLAGANVCSYVNIYCFACFLLLVVYEMDKSLLRRELGSNKHTHTFIWLQIVWPYVVALILRVRTSEKKMEATNEVDIWKFPMFLMG